MSFDILYELFGSIYDEEIVFADELGSWMFTGDEKAFYTAYIQAAAAVCSDEEFVEKAWFVLCEDRDRSCHLKLYSVIKTWATPDRWRRLMNGFRIERSKLQIFKAIKGKQFFEVFVRKLRSSLLATGNRNSTSSFLL